MYVKAGKFGCMKDWRKSDRAKELRDYIDRVYKPRKAGMENLDREIIIDFVAKEIAEYSK